MVYQQIAKLSQRHISQFFIQDDQQLLSERFIFVCDIIAVMSKKGILKGPWSEQEDEALKRLYESTRINKWSQIAEQLELDYGFFGRTGKQCRERYNNYLDPALNHEDWSLLQEKKLFQLHDQLGNKWAIISHSLGIGRTDNSVKNHFFSKLRKSLRRLNKIIQQNYKKEIREIKIKVLYKILEASEEKFKLEPMCDIQTSENCCCLKNKILMFSYNEEQEISGETEQATKDLILQIINFNKNYKRKPKKFRRTSTQGYSTLEVPKEIFVRRSQSNDSFQNSSNSKSNLDSSQQWEDEIDYADNLPKPQERTKVSPIILRSKSQPQFCEDHMLDQRQEQQCVQSGGQEYRLSLRTGEQILDELGLLEELDAAIHPTLMNKRTSLFSRRSSDVEQDQLKFFEDSEIEMRILLAPIPLTLKKESYEEGLFHQ